MSSIKNVNMNEFNELIKSPNLVVVDFFADWCMPCRALSPILEKLQDSTGGKAVFIKINVDENQELSVKYNIQGIPNVKFFKNGNVVKEIVGLNPKSTYLDNINYFALN